MEPYPYDSQVFWPYQIVVLNRDLIGFTGTNNVTVDGKDFSYVDAYGVSSDRQEDGHEATIDFVSKPPRSDVVPFGTLDFTLSLKSPNFPRLAMYECSLMFTSDRNIFDPKRIKSIDVSFDKSASVKLIGDVLNIYKCDLRRLDNWFMIKFCQILEVLDPQVAIRVRVRIDRLGNNTGISTNTRLDITPVLSWYSSITNFLRIESNGEASGSSQSA